MCNLLTDAYELRTSAHNQITYKYDTAICLRLYVCDVPRQFKSMEMYVFDENFNES